MVSWYINISPKKNDGKYILKLIRCDIILAQLIEIDSTGVENLF